MEVISADGTNATIQQKTGNNAAGNVIVTWFYNDGSQPDQQVQEFISNRQAIQFNGGTGTVDSLDRLEVDLNNCEGASTTTYEP